MTGTASKLNEAAPARIRLLLRRAKGLRHAPTRRRWQRQADWFRRVGSPRTVMSGPFKGMVYPKLNWDLLGSFMHDILGVYEMELHDAIEQICAAQPRIIVDVGAASGFYTIGFARRCPDAYIIGFEASKLGVWAHKRNARANNVKIDLRGWCDPEALDAAIGDGRDAVVICDCEGYEATLLDPERVPGLRNTTILVEIHDESLLQSKEAHWQSQFPPNVAKILRDRFGPIHEIEEINERTRTPSDKPDGCPLSDDEFVAAATERRGLKGQWFFMKPLERNAEIEVKPHSCRPEQARTANTGSNI